MRNRKAPVLIEAVPKHYEEGGLFFVDLHVEGLPLLAFRPSIMLKAIGGARLAFAEWSVDGSKNAARKCAD